MTRPGAGYNGELASSILLDEDGIHGDGPGQPLQRLPLSTGLGGLPLFGTVEGGCSSSSGSHHGGVVGAGRQSARGLPPHTRADGEAPNRTPNRTPSPVYQYMPKGGFGGDDVPPYAPLGKSSSSKSAAVKPPDGGKGMGGMPFSSPPLWGGGGGCGNLGGPGQAYFGMMYGSQGKGQPDRGSSSAGYSPKKQSGTSFEGKGNSSHMDSQVYFGGMLPGSRAPGPSSGQASKAPGPAPRPMTGGMMSGQMGSQDHWRDRQDPPRTMGALQPGPQGAPAPVGVVGQLAPGPPGRVVSSSSTGMGPASLAPGGHLQGGVVITDGGRRTKSRNKPREGPAQPYDKGPPPPQAPPRQPYMEAPLQGKGGGKGDRRQQRPSGGQGGGSGGGSSGSGGQLSVLMPLDGSEDRSGQGNGHGGKLRNDARQTGHPLLEQLKRQEKSVELTDLALHISEIAQDQYGSRLIQQKLEAATEEEKQVAFKSVLQKMSQLTTDVFGNYVIQKFFEFGNPEQRRILAEQLVGQVLKLSLQMYGCRVVQKALDSVHIEQQVLLIGELKGHVLKCIEDQHGNHVIQKCIERLPTDKLGFIVDSFLGQSTRMAKHCYGCRVIQRLIEYCNSGQISGLLDEVLTNCTELATDQYGNYVVQHVMEHSSRPGDRQTIMMVLRKNILPLATHKYASNVIEKALTCSNEEERTALVAAIIGEQGDPHPPLLTMMRDRYGNYIVQKVISLAYGANRDLLLWRLHEHMPALKKSNTYGKHIISALERASAGIRD